MRQIAYALAVLLLAALFFVAIPGTGAFVVRGRWRRFRARLITTSLLPTVEYTHLSDAGVQGSMRFLGRLEALQGENTIWVTNGHFSVAADMTGVVVYLMPSSPDALDGDTSRRGLLLGPEEAPRDVRWKQISTLPQGMQIFVAGPFATEKGHGVFRSRDRERLLVVIFDGEPITLLARATLGGRQRNEYWNQYTLISLVLGTFALLLGAYLLIRDPYNRVPALLALTAATFPVSAVLPPGLLLYLPYRQLWERARRLRAERDLVRLPLRHFPDSPAEAETRLPDGERYAVRTGGTVRCRGAPLERVPAHRSDRVDQAATRTYGALGHDELGEYLTWPEDALAELVRVPADPEELARECAHRARLLELLAALLVAADVLVNLFLILLGLSRLIP